MFVTVQRYNNRYKGRLVETISGNIGAVRFTFPLGMPELKEDAREAPYGRKNYPFCDSRSLGTGCLLYFRATNLRPKMNDEVD
jgi:hypothetical protein